MNTFCPDCCGWHAVEDDCVMELRPTKRPPALVVPNEWAEQPDGSLTSGNVMIRNDGGGPSRERWHIYARDEDGGGWVRVWCKSRPYGYGHAGQAKIGVTRLSKPGAVVCS